MEIRPGEIFPDEFDASLFEAAPYTPTSSEKYFDLVKADLTMGGNKVVGEPEFGGYEYHNGEWYIAIYFKDEDVGYMRKLYPAPQDNESEESREA